MVAVQFALADYAVILLYLLAVVFLGWAARRGAGNEVGEYLVAGRRVALPAFVATIVATWYNGVLGVGEMIHYYGLGAWLINGLPYYLFALLFAWQLAPRVREAALYTIPDRLALVYGRPCGIVGGALAFALTNPASNLLMVGLILQSVFPLSAGAALVVGAILSTAYLYAGGLRADVRINVLQFGLMFLGFAVMAGVLVARFGGVSFLRAHLPAEHLRLTGGLSGWVILSWFFIALWTLVEPSFHQRVSAASSARVAQRGLIVAVVCWFLFDALQTTVGLYAWAAFSASGARAAVEAAITARPGLVLPWIAGQVLPAGVKGAFWVGMMAAIMAGAIGFTFVSATALGRDVLWRWLDGRDEARSRYYVWAGLVLATIGGLALALAVPSVVALWYMVGSCVVPALLIPVIGSYFPWLRPSPTAALLVQVLAFGLSMGAFVWGRLHMVQGVEQYPFGLQPLYPGLACALVILVVDRLRRRQPAV